jgi:hypothetical protein
MRRGLPGRAGGRASPEHDDCLPVPVPLPSLLDALACVPDPRKRRGRRYSAAALRTLAVCAIVCGARSLYAIARGGASRAVRTYAPRGGSPAPARRAWRRCFACSATWPCAAFEQALGAWVRAQGRPAGEALALDGKPLRGIHGEAVPGVQRVAAYAHRTGAVLEQKGTSLCQATAAGSAWASRRSWR